MKVPLGLRVVGLFAVAGAAFGVLAVVSRETRGREHDERLARLAAMKIPDADAGPPLDVEGIVVSRHVPCVNRGAYNPECERVTLTPVPGAELFAVLGNEIDGSAPYARMTSAPDGTFHTRLPTGRWCLFRSFRMQPPEDVDPGPATALSPRVSCERMLQRDCDAVVDVPVPPTVIDLTPPPGPAGIIEAPPRAAGATPDTGPKPERKAVVAIDENVSIADICRQRDEPPPP